jgi:hypothetical protein
MTTRDNLHVLIDRLPEESLAAIERYLIAVEAGMPADIAEDDVPLSPEEAAMLAASWTERARGEPTVTHEELSANIVAQTEKIARGWTAMDAIHDRNRDRDPEEVYRDVTAVVEQVRQERYDRERADSSSH